MPTSVTRTWIDANRNFVPDCDLMSGAGAGSPVERRRFLRRVANPNFGKEVYSLSYDEPILKGWCVPAGRLADRGDDAARNPAARLGGGRLFAPLAPELHGHRQPRHGGVRFQPFSLTAPLDPRLPGGGGYVVSGLYNVNPEQVRADRQLPHLSPAYGNVSMVYNGVDVNISARLRNGLQVQGGTSTGQQVIDSCEVRAKLPEQVSRERPHRAASSTTR